MISASIDAKGFGPVTSARIERAMDWCRTVDPAALELGRNDIDGDDVFANVMRFDTAPPTPRTTRRTATTSTSTTSSRAWSSWASPA